MISLRLTLATTAGSIPFFAITRGLPITPRVPRSVIAMEWLLTGNLTAAVWVSLLDTSVVQSPESVANASEQERLQDVLD